MPPPRRSTEPQAASPTESSTTFLALPAELRNVIYELAFEGHRVRINVRTRNPAPGLLLSCKSVFTEAQQMYYHKSTFTADGPRTLGHWLRRIPAASRGSLSCVVVETPTNEAWILVDPYYTTRTVHENETHYATLAAIVLSKMERLASSTPIDRKVMKVKLGSKMWRWSTEEWNTAVECET